MYVTLNLDSTDHPDMAALAKDLHQALGVHFDGLLLRQKQRQGLGSWMCIHTGKGHGRNVDRERALALVQSYLPEVKGVTLYDHVSGIAYNFADGYVRYSP